MVVGQAMAAAMVAAPMATVAVAMVVAGGGGGVGGGGVGGGGDGGGSPLRPRCPAEGAILLFRPRTEDCPAWLTTKLRSPLLLRHAVLQPLPRVWPRLAPPLRRPRQRCP